MDNDTVNKVIFWGAIATIVLAVLGTFDFIFNKWKYVKAFFGWFHLPQFDSSPVVLEIPPPPKGAVSERDAQDLYELVGPPGNKLIKEALEKLPVGVTPDHPNKRVMRTPEVPDPVVTYSGTRLGETSPDGVTKVLKRFILCPSSSGILRAYETTRIGFPGIRYLVERQYRGESQWHSKLTDDKNAANAQWFEWYDEMKKMNHNGFGGCSGTGTGGERPF